MMKTIRNFMGLALIITFAITFLFNISCHKESFNKVIIGGLFAITGNGETLGKASRAALKIAIEDINEFYKGNEKNVKFASSVKDTEGGEPNLALELLKKFLDSGIKLVIGPMSSAEVSVIKYFADSNDIIIVSQSSTAGSLSIAGDNIFRFAPDDFLEGRAITALLVNDGIDSIIPVFRDDAGNEGVYLATADLFRKAMGFVGESVIYDPDIDTVDFRVIVEQLSALVSEQIEEDEDLNTENVAVFLAGFDEVVQIFELAKDDSTLSSVKWYGTDGIVLSQALLTNEGGSSEFAEKVTYPSPTLGLDDRMKRIWGPIAEEITERTGIIPDAFALSVYDIAWTLAGAYLNTEDPKDLETFKDEFILAALELNGITGSTELNEAGDRKSANFDFWGVREVNGIFIWKKVVFFDAANDPGDQITELVE